jgi:dienelactone hydrolase
MRILEIVLVFMSAIRLFVGIKKTGRWLDWLSVCTLGVLGLHLWLEGYRWQMILVYGVVLGQGVLAVLQLVKGKTLLGRWIKRTRIQTVSTLALMIIISLPPLLLPVPKIYKPDGPYPVGTFSLMLVDESREELYSGTPGEPRRLMVQFWYPAELEPGAEFGPWVENPEVIAPAISEFLGFPAFFLDHLQFANGHSYPNAPVLIEAERFPLLLFSHGWNGFRAQNTFQMVALASHGYVVAAPDHTYGAVATVFPDGEIAHVNRQALPSGMDLPEDEFMAAAHILGAQWSGDLSFILDVLEADPPGNEIGTLNDRLDFEQVGALGHSTGGGAAIQFCVQDLRCQAVLGMDPYMDPVALEVLASGTDVPLMGMFSEGRSFRSGDNIDQFAELISNSSGEIYRFEIKNTGHFDFSDLPAFSPLAATFGLKGPLSGERALKIITDYTLAFFGHYFEGEPSEILNGNSEAYPEVIWR